jgi:hypothetical protein
MAEITYRPVIGLTDIPEGYGPDPGELVWSCDCGSIFFYLTPDEVVCFECQKIQEF